MSRRIKAGLAEVAAKGYWRARDARVVVEGWRRSGKTLSQFARDHGLRSERISRWTRVEDASKEATSVEFHPVHVIESVGEPRDPIEVLLADGRRVRVPAGFAGEDLARVLAVLEGRISC